MPTKTRIIIVSFLIVLGGVLFSYCLVFPTKEIIAQARETPAAVIESTEATETKPAPVKETSTGCEEQNKSNQSTENSSDNEKKTESRPRPQPGAI